ncbi:MAG TPA: hypothetical protein PL088_11330 [Spirochaetota bacterium]|nr:hypothetical protein [Spirochaetota bacterium]
MKRNRFIYDENIYVDKIGRTQHACGPLRLCGETRILKPAQGAVVNDDAVLMMMERNHRDVNREDRSQQ